jgi:hypothetical protein
MGRMPWIQNLSITRPAYIPYGMWPLGLPGSNKHYKS